MNVGLERPDEQPMDECRAARVDVSTRTGSSHSASSNSRGSVDVVCEATSTVSEY